MSMSEISDHILGNNSVDSFKNWNITNRSNINTRIFASASNGNRFVIAGDSAYFSSNGITWTQSADLGPDYVTTGVTSKGNTTEWLAVGASEFAWKSTDNGNNWILHSIVSGLSGMRVVASNGSRYVATGSNFNNTGNSSIAATSTDGITWVTSTLPFSSENVYWGSIASNGVNFIAVGEARNPIDPVNTRLRIAITTNGTTWTGIAPIADAAIFQSQPTITSNGTRYVIMMHNILYSDNAGSTWNQVHNVEFQGAGSSVPVIASNGSLFIASTYVNDYALISENGIIYKTKPLPKIKANAWTTCCTFGPSYLPNNGPFIFVESDSVVGASVARVTI